VCCSVLQCVAVFLLRMATCGNSVLQCVAACCSVLRPFLRMATCGSSLLQCVAVCCGVLQCRTISNVGSVVIAHILISPLATGWRRPIGCLNFRSFFRKRATKYRALFAENDLLR